MFCTSLTQPLLSEKEVLASFPTSYYISTSNGIIWFKNKISKIQINDTEILSSVQVHDGYIFIFAILPFESQV